MSYRMDSIHMWPHFFLAMSLLVLAGTGCALPFGQGEPSPADTPGTKLVEEPVLGFASVAVSDVERGRLSRVDIIPSHAIVPAGETMVFSAVTYDEAGGAVDPVEVEARWRMTDPLTGTITTTGVFRGGVQQGVFGNSIEVTVSQQSGGRLVTLQALASVSILRPLSEQDIHRVLVLPDQLRVESETQASMTALALDRAGIPVPDVDLMWEMLNAEAGTIHADGRFTSGTLVGSFPAAIRVVAQKSEDPTQAVAATVLVEVLEAGAVEPPSKVNLFPQAVSLRPGDTMEFRALVLDQRGNLFESVERSWTLSDPTAGDLDGQGRFRAGSTPGTYPNLVEVTVTPLGMEVPVPLEATATVTVLEPVESPERLQRLLLNPQVVRLRPGESLRFGAAALSNSGDVIPSPDLRWEVHEDVVTVSPLGVVTAKDRPGTYPDVVSVKVTHGEGEEQVTQTARATAIILGPLARVDVVPQEVQVASKQMVRFNYVAYDINGVRLFDVSASWDVLDERVGTIDEVGLFIAGDIPGEYKDVIKVTVKPLRLGAGGV